MGCLRIRFIHYKVVEILSSPDVFWGISGSEFALPTSPKYSKNTYDATILDAYCTSDGLNPFGTVEGELIKE